MTFILALMGSPRPDGNTAVLVEQVLRGAVEAGARVQRLDVCDLDLSGCTACGYCDNRPGCSIDDEMGTVYDLLDQADGLVIASPVYFSGPSGQMKSLIDRCQTIWRNGPERSSRPALIISVGGDDKANFRNSVSIFKAFLNSIGFSARAELLVPGMDQAGQVAEEEEVMRQAKAFGRSMVTGSW